MRYFILMFGLMFLLLNASISQEWTYQEDFVYGELPHGVVITPDGKIWVGYYSFTDTLEKPGGDTLPYNPLIVYNSNGSVHKKIHTLTFEGLTDTVFSCRGLSLDNNGNVLLTNFNTLFRINYETYEAMNRVVPNADKSLTEAACDGNGYIYISHVIKGPFYIYDKNFEFYGFVEESTSSTKRSILTSEDGKDLYLGKIYGGPDDIENGIIHYHSDSGPGGVYSKVDSFHTNIWGQCLNWDRGGLLWIGSYWDIAISDSSGWYALDPSQKFRIVNSTGRNVDLHPNEGPQPPEGGTYYSPRGAAWTTDGTLMYTADFDGHVIKKWFNPNPIVSNIQLSIDTLSALAGDTVLVPIDVIFNTYSSYSSMEIDVDGFQGLIEFIKVVSDSSLIGEAGWQTEVNNTDSLLKVASAGSNNINGAGVLCWLQFFIPDSLDSIFVPVTLESAIFNTGSTPVTLKSGGINVQGVFYGDVDLNKIVQAYDASLILKYLVEYIDLDEQQLLNANVSCDTTVSSLDASVILKYVVSLIDTLPYCGDSLFVASGNIDMPDSTGVQSGDTVIVPLFLSDGENILGFDGAIAYDPQQLDYIDTEWSQLLDEFNIETNDDSLKGSIQFAGAGSMPDGEQGTFALLKFVTLDNFSETIINLEELRWNEEEIMEDEAQTVLHLVSDINNKDWILPQKYELNQNFPNPFNPETRIKFGLPKASHVKLEVFNMLGQKVAVLIDGRKPAGYHEVTFDGSNLASGVYYYRIETEKFIQVKKMLLVK